MPWGGCQTHVAGLGPERPRKLATLSFAGAASSGRSGAVDALIEGRDAGADAGAAVGVTAVGRGAAGVVVAATRVVGIGGGVGLLAFTGGTDGDAGGGGLFLHAASAVAQTPIMMHVW